MSLLRYFKKQSPSENVMQKSSRNLQAWLCLTSGVSSGQSQPWFQFSSKLLDLYVSNPNLNTCQWLSARLLYLQCVSNGDTIVLH